MLKEGKTIRISAGLLVSLLALALMTAVATAGSGDIVVNTTLDDVDANGNCTLREAIIAANTDAQVDACPAGNGADTVKVPAGTYVLTLAGPRENASLTGDIDITEDLTLVGKSAQRTVIDANGMRDPAIHTHPGTVVTISGLTIANARNSGGNGGGIFATGALTVIDSVITNNVSGDGGGILSDGAPSLTVKRTTVSDNISENEGGGVAIFNQPNTETIIAKSVITRNEADVGGGIADGTNLTLIDSTVSNNSAFLAAGGISNGSRLTLVDSTVSGNVAVGVGGGIINFGAVSMSNCVLSDNSSSSDGGGVYNRGTLTVSACLFDGNSTPAFFRGGGAINNDAGGRLDIIDSTFVDNSADGWGGAIRNNDGTATIMTSTFSRNSANTVGGAIYNNNEMTISTSIISENSSANRAGGIYNDIHFQVLGKLRISQTQISNNSALWGGGAYNSGTMTIEESTLAGNVASRDGGGVYNAVNSRGNTLSVLNSAVVGNVASWRGAGIYNPGDLTVSNSTFSANSAGWSGGGILTGNPGTFVGGFLSLNSSTFSGNSAGSGGALKIFSGSGIVRNTIIADSGQGQNCDGDIPSGGHNIVSDGSCDFAEPTDQENANPMIGPLADNGGPTTTHALLPGSPAIDMVPGADCTDHDGNALATDQRGMPRPLGAACDIGAYEGARVEIDVKPEGDRNAFNCNQDNVVITVALLTTTDFDARTVDHTTVIFEGAGELHAGNSGEARRHEKDVDHDGDTDLVFHFRLADTGLTCQSTEGQLVAETFAGEVVDGVDELYAVPGGG